jgi:hypothetical protein
MTLPGTPPREVPPALSANRVSGHLFAWCWQGTCADGVVNFAAPQPYPDARIPITLQPEQPVSSISASAIGPDQRNTAPVVVEGTNLAGAPLGGELKILEMPPGDWTLLHVGVRYAGGGSAEYLWELVKPEPSP